MPESLEIKDVMNGAEHDSLRTPQWVLNEIVRLLRIGELREVTWLANVLQMLDIWLPGVYYFDTAQNCTLRYEGWSNSSIGHMRLANGDRPRIEIEFGDIGGSNQDVRIRKQMLASLLADEMYEVSLLRTYGSDEYTTVDRIFRTYNGSYVEVVAPDGPLPGGYGELGKVRQWPDRWKILDR